MNEHKVYVRTDASGAIIEINSSSFLSDTTGWTQIDEGEGDKYHHAQGNYLPLGLIDNNGLCNYKLVDGSITVRTTEEKAPEIAAVTAQARIKELKSLLAATDYTIIKIAEGAAQPAEYADVISGRAEWRAEINRLEQ